MKQVFLCALFIAGIYFSFAPQNALAGCSGTVFSVSIVGYNTAQNHVFGYEAEAISYSLAICYDPAISGVLDPICAPTGEGSLDYDEDVGFSYWIPAEVFLFSNNYQPNTYYTSLGDLFLIDWYYGDTRYVGYNGVCIRTPPFCVPFDENGTPAPCPTPPITPTPTPTPTPPTVTISPIDAVEKYGEKSINVSITNNSAGTTNFTLRTTNGTGSATFENGTNQVTINGNATNQELKIKGITESSQADNITIEAKPNGRTTVVAHEEFTVAVITSLEFERINMDDTALDNNPGNGQPNTNVGQRIFPDHNSPTDGTDRSIIRVTANISPSVIGVKVYFASFDLDDPSANATPIDTNASGGNDNNGVVNGSRSGEFIAPAGSTCTTVVTNMNISQIGCDTTTKGATTNYKVTMQPGDNFAVAASFSDIYRNGIRLNAADGSIIENSASQAIPLSGGTNPNNVAGLRTRMLTTWRRLHIEVDSMGNVNSNFVIGTITDTRKVNSGNQTLNLSVTNLRPNRFENGRLVIRRNGTIYKSLRVIDATYDPTTGVVINSSNTASSVTVFNNLGTFNVANGDSFILYDDDDMDDEDTGNLNGDDGDNVPAPRSDSIPDIIRSNDTACSDTFNANNCNVFVNAYVRPVYDLTGEDINLFSANTDDIDRAFYRRTYFQNRNSEASEVFWTVWLFGAYQDIENVNIDLNSDGDPGESAGTFGVVDNINGEGASIFTELLRPNEYTSLPTPTTRPVGKRFTVAHEIGHLFFGLHEDWDDPATQNAGLMAQSGLRQSPLFTDTTINKIRGGMFYDPISMTTRRITHP